MTTAFQPTSLVTSSQKDLGIIENIPASGRTDTTATCTTATRIPKKPFDCYTPFTKPEWAISSTSSSATDYATLKASFRIRDTWANEVGINFYFEFVHF